jgi:hypothetical protein
VCVPPPPEHESEIRKSLFSSLREGATLVLLDNAVRGKTISSPSLAAFLTSIQYGGRILGQSATAFYFNGTVVFITGNGLALSRELSSRALPVELIPQDGHPERRTDLPLLGDLIATYRLSLLSTIHGMIQAWVAAGSPTGRVAGLAGFEDWQRVVGGVLELWGLGAQVGANVLTWRSDADVESSDDETFLKVWQDGGGESRDWSAKQLLAIASNEGLFPEVFARDEHGRLVAFSKTILGPLIEVPRDLLNDNGVSQKYRVIRTGKSSSRRGHQYRLEVS